MQLISMLMEQLELWANELLTSVQLLQVLYLLILDHLKQVSQPSRYHRTPFIIPFQNSIVLHHSIYPIRQIPVVDNPFL